MNRNSKMILLFLCALCLTTTVQSQQEGIYSRLKRQFDAPPLEAWPKTYWWWLNGNIDTVRMKEEILAMKKAGLSGFDIFEIGAPKSDTIIPTGEITFMADDFLRVVKVALDQAEQLDMEVGLNMASSWNAGGSWITPEHAAKSIYYSKIPFSGRGMKIPFPRLVRTKLEGKIQLGEDQEEVHVAWNPDGKPAYYHEIAILAIPQNLAGKQLRSEDVVDVTEYFDPKAEQLNWTAPGAYDIYRYICSNSGEYLKLPSKNSIGPIIDHFDAAATEFHFNYIIERLKTILGADVSGSSLKSLYLASYEALGTVWTESLPEKFEQLQGNFELHLGTGPPWGVGNIFPRRERRTGTSNFSGSNPLVGIESGGDQVLLRYCQIRKNLSV